MTAVLLRRREGAESLARRFDALFEGVFGASGLDDEEVDWTPRLDLYETEGTVIARVELPGLTLAAINVHLDGDVLVISGERHEGEAAGERLLRAETPRGRFCRRLPLGRLPLDLAGVSARFTNGVLEIRLPPAKNGR